MLLNKTKWAIMTLAICFAILQAMLPFIHAHLDGEHHSHNGGLHMAENHKNSHAIDYLIGHAISDPAHTHTISVPHGIKQETASALLNDALPFILACIWLTLVVSFIPKHFPQLSLISSHSFTRRLPAPRAPPLF